MDSSSTLARRRFVSLRKRNKPNRWRERCDAALDKVNLVVSVVESIADGPVNVPVLKGAASLTGKIIAVVQVSFTSNVSGLLDQLT